MHALDPKLWAQLALPEEKSCAVHGSHARTTGSGAFFVDRWPDPRALGCFTGGNLELSGEADALAAGSLGTLIASLRTEWDHLFIVAPGGFEARLRDEADELHGWPRVMFTGGREAPPDLQAPAGARVAPITADHTRDLEGLSDDIAWVADTHGGPEGLARSELAFGCWSGPRLVSVAAPFFIGDHFEELGVVTEVRYRGRGANPACSAALVRAIRARGKTPCWSTTPANIASQRVAEKLGLRRERDELHFMVGAPLSDSIPLD